MRTPETCDISLPGVGSERRPWEGRSLHRNPVVNAVRPHDLHPEGTVLDRVAQVTDQWCPGLAGDPAAGAQQRSERRAEAGLDRELVRVEDAPVGVFEIAHECLRELLVVVCCGRNRHPDQGCLVQEADRHGRCRRRSTLAAPRRACRPRSATAIPGHPGAAGPEGRPAARTPGPPRRRRAGQVSASTVRSASERFNRGSDPRAPRISAAGTDEAAGRTHGLACGFGGGQGRGRTADLPLFRRTLVPTELPGRTVPVTRSQPGHRTAPVSRGDAKPYRTAFGPANAGRPAQGPQLRGGGSGRAASSGCRVRGRAAWASRPRARRRVAPPRQGPTSARGRPGRGCRRSPRAGRRVPRP